MDGIALDITDSERDIGVMIESNFHPKKQCEKAANTATTVLRQIERATTGTEISTSSYTNNTSDHTSNSRHQHGLLGLQEITTHLRRCK